MLAVLTLPEASRSFAPPSVLPDISPTGGEIGLHFGRRSFCNAAD